MSRLGVRIQEAGGYSSLVAFFWILDTGWWVDEKKSWALSSIPRWRDSSEKNQGIKSCGRRVLNIGGV